MLANMAPQCHKPTFKNLELDTVHVALVRNMPLHATLVTAPVIVQSHLLFFTAQINLEGFLSLGIMKENPKGFDPSDSPSVIKSHTA